MIYQTILLNNFGKAKNFISLANSTDYDISLQSTLKTVNAKNFDDVLSLDLTKPVTMILENDDPNFLKNIEEYICF